MIAGGSGERLWPLSRRARPKPLLPVAGGRPLLAATLERAARLAPRERTWLVCTADNAAALRRVARLPRGHVLVEPRPRNTAMAIAHAAARLEARDPEAVLVVLPADHVIPDARAFAGAIRKAARAAARGGALVTLGVAPTRPETGYGYIRVGDSVGAEHPGIHRVRGFEEKPTPARARRLLRGGQHLWNAGIFVWSARTILEEIERHEPALARAIAPLRGRVRPSAAAVERAYARAPSLAIDVAVLERSRRVWTLPIYFHWNDVGSWAAVAAELAAGNGRSVVAEGEVLLEDAPGNFVWGNDRPIALLGVEGLAVVDAGDALLVMRLDRSGDLRRIVAKLRERGRRDVL